MSWPYPGVPPIYATGFPPAGTFVSGVVQPDGTIKPIYGQSPSMYMNGAYGYAGQPLTFPMPNAGASSGPPHLEIKPPRIAGRRGSISNQVRPRSICVSQKLTRPRNTPCRSTLLPWTWIIHRRERDLPTLPFLTPKRAYPDY
jgi:hypothetical protein